MSMSLSQKDVYTMIFKEYPDVVSVTQMSKMLGISEKVRLPAAEEKLH